MEEGWGAGFPSNVTPILPQLYLPYPVSRIRVRVLFMGITTREIRIMWDLMVLRLS
jgi:hypothetical protein